MRIFVAMSGGVDSSVAAAMLLEQGHDVAGVTMRLREPSGLQKESPSAGAARDAKQVCDLLGIEHYTLDYRELFDRQVVQPYVAEYAAGRTPSPCILCNDRLKFSSLLDEVLLRGADALATGHYARVVRDEGGRAWLARGADSARDQSYFLYRLSEAKLGRVLFPVGGLAKSEVRAYAERLGLPIAGKLESREACFAPEGPSALLASLTPSALKPGAIVDAEGNVLGHHSGIGRYTVGQRRGIGLAGGPWFVTAIDAGTNTITVGPEGSDRVQRIVAREAVWHGGEAGLVRVQLRYRARCVEGRVGVRADSMSVDLTEPATGVAPGQAVVCYRDDIVVGGGTILCTAS